MTITKTRLRAKALAFLAKREHSYLELIEKLKPHADLNLIKEVLDELKDKNWLSEERYINSYINSKSKKQGLSRIKYELKQKVAETHLVDQALDSLELDEFAIAYQIWQRKFKQLPQDKKEYMRQFRFLQNRGFSFDTIRRVLSHLDLD